MTATQRIHAAYTEAQILMVTHYDDRELRAAGASGYVLKDDLLGPRSLLQ